MQVATLRVERGEGKFEARKTLERHVDAVGGRLQIYFIYRDCPAFNALCDYPLKGIAQSLPVFVPVCRAWRTGRASAFAMGCVGFRYRPLVDEDVLSVSWCHGKLPCLFRGTLLSGVLQGHAAAHRSLCAGPPTTGRP